MGLIPLKEVHVTKDKLRYRIQDPAKFSKLRTKKTSKGVELILEFK